jgi:hypothetical protein
MMQLSFQPAFDPLHAIFRILRLLEVVKNVGTVHRDLLRIMDFYLLFPYRIGEIRLAPTHRPLKRLATAYASTKPYGEQPDREVIFQRMEPMHIAALDTLASHEYISRDDWNRNIVRPTDKALPNDLRDRVLSLNKQQSDLMDFMKLLATSYQLSGTDGLKSRTGLMEFRYDAA